MNAPLEGIVVADFSRVLAGPLATAMLADLGAFVIKVERSGTGDDTRQWGPPWTDSSSSYFECANRTKQSIELDFSDEHDLALARDLALRADILVENFREGTLAKMGLGYEQLRLENPGLVYCSITGFGSRGGASLPGYDFLVQAMGGLMSITGQPEGQPTKVGVALVDILTSKDAVIGILAALAARDKTAHGQRIEVNLLSSLLGSLANQASSYLATGIAPTRMGNEHPSIAPYQTLLCRDGYLTLCCGNDSQFERLVSVMGVPRLAKDERFATNSARVENRVELTRVLEDNLAVETVDTWSRRLLERGVPAGRVGDIGSAITLAESLGLQPTVDMGAGNPRQIRHPVTYSETPVSHYGPPPGLGEHNAAVRQWLDENRRIVS